MRDLIIGIVSGIVATALIWGVTRLVKYFREGFRSEYSGEWESEIFDNLSRQNVEKKDHYNLKYNKRTHEIKGKIDRMMPLDQNYRKWDFTGIMQDGYIIFTFWSADRNHRSSGCVCVKHVGDYKYEGFYLEEHRIGTIDKTPITLYKKRMVETAAPSRP